MTTNTPIIAPSSLSSSPASQWNQKTLRRAHLLATILLLLTASLLLGLLIRVAWIQKHVTPEDTLRLDRQHDALQSIMADRGPIRFADGTVVAASVRMYNLYADPAFIMDPTGKTLARWKLQQELDKTPPTDPRAADLQKQIAALDSQITESAPQSAAARKILAQALEPLLGTNAPTIEGLIEDNATYHSSHSSTPDPSPMENRKSKIETPPTPRRFLWLARDVDDSFHQKFLDLKKQLHEQAHLAAKDISDPKNKDEREAAHNKALLLDHALDGVGFSESIQRQYPLAQLAGPIIGIANNYGGVDGMEKQLDPLLQGRLGEFLLLKDSARHTLMIEDKSYTPPDHGCAVWLTLDTMLQSIAEDELADTCTHFKAESGCAILMDPYSGRIYAMANYPAFDPSHFQQADPAARTNKCVVDPYEPGSIFKPFILAWALENHIVRPTDVIDGHAGNWYDPTGRLVRDHEAFGPLTVEDALVYSSNVVFTQIGWKMGIPLVHQAVDTFGFGRRTGVELPGDGKGLVDPLPKWNKGTLTSASFGYAVATTPLQLIRAFATFSNGGYLITPRIINAVETEPGKATPWEDLAAPPMKTQILSPQTCDTMRTIMEQVYIRGTAKESFSHTYRLFGKTGTAHLAITGAGHYSQSLYNSSFLAGGPASNPRLIALVTIHKPDSSFGYYGAKVAAPPCTHILERALAYLQIPPDQPPSIQKKESIAKE